MKLFTILQYERLLHNGRNPDQDHAPVVKIFTPDAQCTWLLTEIDPDYPDIAFGLCDLGLGFPELGSVSINELKGIRGALGLPVECDCHFSAQYPISVYALAASVNQQITLSSDELRKAHSKLFEGGRHA